MNGVRFRPTGPVLRKI